MTKYFKRLLSIIFICMTLTTATYATVATEVSVGGVRNTTAQIYDGLVRINTLSFENNGVKEPILLYQGSYYLPMTPAILKNLGMTVAISSEGLFEYSLSVPQVVAIQSSLSKYDHHEMRVPVYVYQKDVSINGFVISEEEVFHPVIIYNNTFYLPLTGAVIETGLEIDLEFTEERTLTIHRNLDKMIQGTVELFPDDAKRVFFETAEKDLMQLKESLLESGEHFVLDGQEQYVMETDEGEDVYVIFDDGSWLVASQPKDVMGTVLHYFAENGDRYIGQYKNQAFSGQGRYIDVNGNVTAIKPFEHTPSEQAYLDRSVAYLEYMPLLTLLVEFSDESIIGSEEKWYEKIFGQDQNTLRGYYKEVTHDALNLIPALETDGIMNDGIIKIKLDRPHPNTGQEIGETRALLEEIALALEDKVALKVYDRNDNGVLDQEELGVLVILAGYESSRTTPADYPQFRAHHLFSDISLAMVDQIGLMNVIYVSELEYFSGATELTTMAVFAHELGHQFGLPDLYDIDDSSKGLGPFSLMAEGTGNYYHGQRPGEIIAHFDPWSLIQLKAVTPDLINSSGEYELSSMETGNYNIIRINTENENEYFLIENRRVEGRDLGFRNSLRQNGGILIYHIDESIINENYETNTINSNESRKGIDIEEASERTTGALLDSNEYSERLAPFFTAKGQSLFGEVTKPNSSLNDRSQSGIMIEVLTDGPISKVRITLDN